MVDTILISWKLLKNNVYLLNENNLFTRSANLKKLH